MSRITRDIEEWMAPTRPRRAMRKPLIVLTAAVVLAAIILKFFPAGLDPKKLLELNFHLKVVGILMLLLATAHVGFPKRFGWKEELGRLSLLNRQIFLVHCFFICLLLGLCGALSLVFTDTLLQRTALARVVLGGLSIFWSVRLFTQLFIYDSKLWRGNPFNTAMHILFSLMWTYYIAVYTAAFWRQCQ